jgi:hypothetical protein
MMLPFRSNNPQARTIYSLAIIAAVIYETSDWIVRTFGVQKDLEGDLDGIMKAKLRRVQDGIFGGLLVVETVKNEQVRVGFVDNRDQLWAIPLDDFVYKWAEGPMRLPFVRGHEFKRRNGGCLRRIGGEGGMLEVWEGPHC